MITVIAGVNGAGKSSIAGSAIEASGGAYYNPDVETRKLLQACPELDEGDANALVWQAGVNMLAQAIDQDFDFVFETTLGGNTITSMLIDAARRGTQIQVWYCGLDSVDTHVERVRARVAKGGHDIPLQKIRERYDASRLNMARLGPLCETVWIFDNSTELDAASGRPQPRLVLRQEPEAIEVDMDAVPDWAKSIVAAMLAKRGQHIERL